MASNDKPPAGSGTTMQSSIRTTLFLESFTLLSLTVLAVMAATYYLAGHELTVRTAAQLDFAAASKEYLFETTISRQREQLSVLGRDPQLITLPSVMNLVGFRELYRVNQAGIISRLSPDTGPETALPETIVREGRMENRTFFHPFFDGKGWTSYLIIAPQINQNGDRTGTLVAIFDPSILIARLLETTYLGSTAQIILATSDRGEIVLLHSGVSPTGPMLARLTDTTSARSAIYWQTFGGKEGNRDTVDYAGIRVLASSRFLPSIQWVIVVQLDRYELLEPVLRLAANLIGSGLILVTLLSLSVFFLARHIVGPLEELARKLNNLEARHWRFKRSIFTRNELEVVDRAAYNLTRRLREAHDHLEDIVKQRTQALQAQHAEDAAILENIDYGLLVTDRDGLAVYMNKAGELLTDWHADDIRNTASAGILRIMDRNGQEIPPENHPLINVLKTKERFNPETDPEFTLLRRNGSQSALQLRIAPILRGKQCLGAVAVFRDITEERRIDHMKSDFISLVSHQLRTPLSSMRWYLEMLLAKDAGTMNTQQEQYVEEVMASNSRMVHLVNALLNVSRLELGKIQLNPETIDLVRMLNEIKDSFKLELKRKKMDIVIAPKQLATIEVQSDRGLLQLILENLVNNAIKYGHEGTSVDVRMAFSRPQKLVTIAISDQGIGIPENQQPNIFKKLFRGTNARLSDAEGSGLGLYISHISAESIGGKLTFKSKEGAGTTFLLTIPAIPAKKTSTDKEQPSAK